MDSSVQSQQSPSQQQQQQSQKHNNNQNDNRKIRKSPDTQHTALGIMPGVITRERSFVRTPNQQQQQNKRRSLAFNVGGNQLRGKPALDIYRPPNVRDNSNAMNKLNVYAQEFTMMSNTRSSPPGDANLLSRSSTVYTSGNDTITTPHPKLHQQHVQFVPTTTTSAATNAINHRRQAGLSMPLTTGGNKGHNLVHRPILVTHSHPMQYNPITGAISHQIPLMNSPSGGNILHQAPRVKFAANTQKYHNNNNNNNSNKNQNHHIQLNNDLNQVNYNKTNALQPSYIITDGGIPIHQYGTTINVNPLQRSKSLSSADALTRGIAGLGLVLGNEITDIGQFPPEIQALIDTALDDPNKLNSRALMELTSQFIKRSVEGRRYALPISRLCLNIIAKEQKETFLEALLNTCRQWYQEREKLLFTIQGMKSPSRARFTAFMAFLTEMFCQLKRRQLQIRTQNDTSGGTSPPLVLLTLLSKCCEDCVKPPIRSLSEIECLFYVLTCIGLDMEMHLPQQLEIILALARDAFLNANDAAPAIRRTLLQLIELQASHWQLPGNTVLYYYTPS